MFDKKLLALGYKRSAIREVYTYSLKRKAEIGDDKVFDFSLGNPSIPAPKIVEETINRILREEDSVRIHGYTIAPGELSIRNEIAKYLNKTYKTEVEGKYIFMTCGASSSLAIIAKAVLFPGDEVIVFAPHFPEHRVYSEAVGGVVIPIKPRPDFLPNFEEFEAKITDKCKLVIYNSPNNPTGVFYDEQTIIRLTDILKKKEKEYGHPIYLLSDEPYRELLYNGEKYPFITNYYNNSFVAYSFSKCLSLPGERIGYVLVNPKCEDVDDVFACVMGAARLLGYICAPSLFQFMIPEVLGYTSSLEEYKENRDILYKALVDIGYEAVYPTGAFYLFVKTLEPEAEKFVEVAKKFELYLVPSDSFDYPGYVRLSYCKNKNMILNSIPAFKALFDYYKTGKNL